MAMTTIKGPAIFLAQYAGDAAPFNSLDSICKWAGSLGFKGVQMPSWDGRLFDLKKAAESHGGNDALYGAAVTANILSDDPFATWTPRSFLGQRTRRFAARE